VCRYTCIWIQWCLLYLTDEDVVTLFERAREGLQPGGLIMVKENICKKVREVNVTYWVIPGRIPGRQGYQA
jgi:hypothetical protein